MAKAKRTRVAIHIPAAMFDEAKQDAELLQDSISGVLTNIIIKHYSPIIEAKRAQSNKAVSDAIREAAKPTKEPKPKKLTQREKLAQVEKLVSKANKAIGRDGLRLEDIGAGLTLYDHYEQAAASSEPDYMLKYLNNVYGGALVCDDEAIINEMRLEGNFTLEFYEQCTGSALPEGE